MRRPAVVRIDASSVQGEGAWIEWRRMTYGERKDALEKWLALEEGPERVAFVESLLYDHLSGWNFVDEQGQPLPLPKSAADEGVLYVEEVDFLYDTLRRAITNSLTWDADSLKN